MRRKSPKKGLIESAPMCRGSSMERAGEDDTSVPCLAISVAWPPIYVKLRWAPACPGGQRRKFCLQLCAYVVFYSSSGATLARVLSGELRSQDRGVPGNHILPHCRNSILRDGGLLGCRKQFSSVVLLKPKAGGPFNNCSPVHSGRFQGLEPAASSPSSS